MSATAGFRVRRWKRVEYDRMIECGIFRDDERIELIDGLLLVKEPQSVPHMSGIRRVAAALRRAFGPGWVIEGQSPVALDDDSEPEPDVSVLPGRLEDYESAHPVQPALVVEVAVTRLAFDRKRKGGLYARARIPEYWIVNLVDRVLEVHRLPRRSTKARYGWRYAEVQILGPGSTITPLSAPTAAVSVIELLPRQPS